MEVRGDRAGRLAGRPNGATCRDGKSLRASACVCEGRVQAYFKQRTTSIVYFRLCTWFQTGSTHHATTAGADPTHDPTHTHERSLPTGFTLTLICSTGVSELVCWPARSSSLSCDRITQNCTVRLAANSSSIRTSSDTAARNGGAEGGQVLAFGCIPLLLRGACLSPQVPWVVLSQLRLAITKKKKKKYVVRTRVSVPSGAAVYYAAAAGRRRARAPRSDPPPGHT